MRRHARLFVAVLAVFGLIAPASDATPIDNQQSVTRGANRLLELQAADGRFPFEVGNALMSENVQGITAIGLLEAFKLSGDIRYLDAAKKTRNYLATIANAGPCPSAGDFPPCRLAAPNIYFLAEFALLNATPSDLTLARKSLDEQIARWGGPAALVAQVLSVRKNAGNGNLGLWDAGLLMRAAQDVGRFAQADQMALALNQQTTVNPFDANATYHALGLAGIIIGLSESEVAGNILKVQAAQTALKALQAANGSVPLRYDGVTYPNDTQSTAYAVLALTAIADVEPALRAADFLRSTQRANGGFAPWLPEDATPKEFAEVNAEAIAALVAATLLVPSGAVAYTDQARQAP